MNRNPVETKEQAPSPVEAVADVIRTFDRKQKARLLHLVPELRTIPLEQQELMDWVEQEMAKLPETRRLQGDDPFLYGLTLDEFFDLPEAAQDRLWRDAHIEAEKDLNLVERDVPPDAVPA